MAVPLIGRDVAAAVGALIVLVDAGSVIGTLIVPRPAASRLTRQIDWLVDRSYVAVTARISSYRRRDRVLATQAATLLLCQLIVWLVLFYVGYSLLFWPFVRTGITAAFSTAGPALWEIGSARVHGGGERAILDIASLTGIVTVTLQIAYLPTLYSAFNRRENEVTLLNGRAGVPSWGPELLARTHYALGSGVSTIDTLPDLYAAWERWAADVAESHSTYLPLVRFRSPGGLSSWVTSLLAILDSAALFLALSPGAAPVVPARLCLRGGFECLNRIARVMSLRVPDEPESGRQTTLTYQEFLDAIERMRKVDFPIERDPEDAWPDFAGWRVNYEQAAYAVAYAVDAVPALWSGPRRRAMPQIAPKRPPRGRPPESVRGSHPSKSARRARPPESARRAQPPAGGSG
jgi:hypothetical protein